MQNQLFLTECPRDAMQGLAHFVPTETKIKYLNSLLEVGFERLDFGSFVSPKAIPQMRDTGEIIGKLRLGNSKTKLLAIVANLRGADQACEFEEIDLLGFPLSVSEIFQQKNTQKSIANALEEIAKIQNLCLVHGKELVVYLSMAFGNPYEESYSTALVQEKGEKVLELGVTSISLADTVGMAHPLEISRLFSDLGKSWPHINLTAHLHSNPYQAKEKIRAAWQAGCRRFDVALGGFGGCPMAKDDLVGNLGTEQMLDWAAENQIHHGLKLEQLKEPSDMMKDIFYP